MNFRPDGTFLLTGVRSQTGAYRVEGGKLTLQVGDRPDVARIAFDGAGLRLDQDGRPPSRFVRCGSAGGGAAMPAASPVLAAVKALTTKALDEQRLFLTCSATVPEQFGQLSKFWLKDVQDAVAMLSANRETASYAAEFAIAANLNKLVAQDQPFASVIALCRSRPWHNDLLTFNFTVLALKLPAVLGNR